jgi:hypothetical protein
MKWKLGQLLVSKKEEKVALEQEIFTAANRESMVAERVRIIGEIAFHESALAGLKEQEVHLRSQILESLVSSKYEPPKIGKHNPTYGRTESPIDYMPESSGLRGALGRMIRRCI